MKIGDTADWKELSRIARENIILKDRLSQVCGDCKWSHICRDKADKMKNLHYSSKIYHDKRPHEFREVFC